MLLATITFHYLVFALYISRKISNILNALISVSANFPFYGRREMNEVEGPLSLPSLTQYTVVIEIKILWKSFAI